VFTNRVLFKSRRRLQGRLYPFPSGVYLQRPSRKQQSLPPLRRRLRDRRRDRITRIAGRKISRVVQKRFLPNPALRALIHLGFYKLSPRIRGAFRYSYKSVYRALFALRKPKPRRGFAIYYMRQPMQLRRKRTLRFRTRTRILLRKGLLRTRLCSNRRTWHRALSPQLFVLGLSRKRALLRRIAVQNCLRKYNRAFRRRKNSPLAGISPTSALKRSLSRWLALSIKPPARRIRTYHSYLVRRRRGFRKKYFTATRSVRAITRRKRLRT
jgi:hypothetical protein